MTIRGTHHMSEPEDFDNGRAFDGDSWSGNLWEVDLYDENDPLPTVGDFLESARDVHGLAVDDLMALWLDSGSPSALVDARQVRACLVRALEAGHDVYDSDTRSYIFARGERVRCEACPECEESTERWLQQR